jgi:hypothetical protein
MARPILYTALLLAASVSFSYARTANAAGAPSPLVFTQNKGQIIDQNGNQRKDIDFRVETPGMSIFIGDGQVHYQWYRSLNQDSRDLRITKIEDENKSHIINQQSQIETYRLDVTLVGANPDAEIITEEETEYYERYFLSYCNGVTPHSYRKITYKNVYPNIDLVFYVNQQSLKYDFIVHPGGDAKQIKLKYEGATSLSINDGVLTANTPFGNIIEQKPYSYLSATNKEISSSFVLSGNVLSFDVEPTNNATVVIDPSLNWSSYYGIVDGAHGNCVAVDTAGNGYIAGFTSSSSNIATFGSHQYSYVGNYDAFIGKLSPDGSYRIWGTYYGGGDYDGVNVMVYDPAGYIYVAGQTSSTSGIVINTVHQMTNGGTGFSGTSRVDGFLAKFDIGGGLLWGTYYGGAYADIINGLARDEKNNLYIGGQTASDTGIASANPFQGYPPGGDGFVAKFNVNGMRQWGTYYSGTVNAVAADTAGNVYIGGAAPTSLLVATAGSHQSVYGGFTHDGFVAKFNTSGVRQWGTYYGGSSIDEVFALACDVIGNVYAGGRTFSTSGIASTGAFRTVLNPGSPAVPDAFLVKFNSAGVRQWGTYYGADLGADYISGITISPDCRNVYISGSSDNTTGITTPNGHKTTSSGGANTAGDGEAFLVKFNHLGVRKYGTFYGGSSSEMRPGIAYANGKLAFGGQTYSVYGGIATGGAWGQPLLPPPGPGPPPPPPDMGFVSLWQADTAVYFDRAYNDTNICLGDFLSISCKTVNRFKANNVFTVQLSNASGSFASPVNVGTVNDSVGSFLPFMIPTNTPVGAGYRLRVIASSPLDTALDNGKNIRISAYPQPRAYSDSPVCVGGPLNLYDTSSSVATDYKWYGPTGNLVGTTQNVLIPNMPATSTGNYVIEIINYACITRDTVHVTVLPNPDTLSITSNSPLCTGDTLRITATTVTPGVYYIWLTQHSPPIYLPNAPATYADSTVTLADSGWYKVAAVLGGCISRQDSIRIKVDTTVVPSVAVSASPGTAVKTNMTIIFSTVATNTGSAPTYQWKVNGVAVPGATAAVFSGVMSGSIQHNDVICVEMLSNAVCARPALVTDCVTVINEDVSVGQVSTKNNFRLYPNPNDGNFTVLFAENLRGEVAIEVMNAIGQQVYKKTIQQTTNNLQLNLSQLPNGVYLLKLKTGNGTGAQRFTLDK